MSSPIPPDPYLALGVPKDADITAIRSAHRKLVLKLHPDRIQDEAGKLKGKDEFQKVQQAYELLSDPDRRSRYDDRIKLAALRKEAMARESPMRTTSTSYAMPMRPAPPSHNSSSTRRDNVVYEERRPNDYGKQEDYFGSRESFSSRDRYDDEPSKASARKHDLPSERRSSTKSAEPSKTKKSAWDTAAGGMSVKMGLKLKVKATNARERVQDKARDKEREREKIAAKAKARDQEQRRERLAKHSRQAQVEDDCSTDSDTVTQVTDATIREAKIETVRPSSKSSPRSSVRPEAKRSSERSRRYDDEDEEDVYEDPWEHRHMGAAEYIASSGNRPGLGRADTHSYWQNEERSRRSGSDSDKRPTSSKGRRSEADGSKVRPPSMPTHSSSPGHLHPHVEERTPREIREPQRSASGSSVQQDREREHRREMPSFSRSKTMPASRSSKKDSAPVKSSNLKHAETQDSGYGSSSSPHTPELGGTSPTRDSRESRRDVPRQTSSKTKYQIHIVDPAEEDDYGRPGSNRPPTVILDDEDRHRRYQSPERRTERPERPRVVTSDRSKSSRVPSSKVESPSSRTHDMRRDSGRRSTRDSPPISRHNSGRGAMYFGQVVDDDTSSYFQQPDSPKHDSYGRREGKEDRDYLQSSRHRENFLGSRRSSVDVR